MDRKHLEDLAARERLRKTVTYGPPEEQLIAASLLAGLPLVRAEDVLDLRENREETPDKQ
jgi:predicted aconitase with swiveling domain